MQEQHLMLISRDDLLDANSAHDPDVFRLLAWFTRKGFHLVATAPQPEQWKSKYGGPDEALLGPDSIRKRLADAGGVLDGVYYVPRSLLTQKRNREEALRDIMKRYAAQAERCYLFSSSYKFVEAAKGLGIQATHLRKDRMLLKKLEKLKIICDPEA
jgi:hypothetical protein